MITFLVIHHLVVLGLFSYLDASISFYEQCLCREMENADV